MILSGTSDHEYTYTYTVSYIHIQLQMATCKCYTVTDTISHRDLDFTCVRLSAAIELQRVTESIGYFTEAQTYVQGWKIGTLTWLLGELDTKGR